MYILGIYIISLLLFDSIFATFNGFKGLSMTLEIVTAASFPFVISVFLFRARATVKRGDPPDPEVEKWIKERMKHINS